MNDSVVVYRSRIEQMQDEYWMNFLENNPEIILWGSSIFTGFFILFFLTVLFLVIRSFYRMSRPFKKNRF